LHSDSHTTLKNADDYKKCLSVRAFEAACCEEEDLSEAVNERLFGVLLRLAFAFEPLAPPAISFYLSRRLNELKDRGIIGNYKTRARRLGKFHYTVQIDMDLTGEQAFHVMDDMLPKQLKHLRR